ncbi:hypothetical protein ACFS5M_10895 [Lacinutrix iliipiscaria]|uniref:Uncharacterized protein n=1 Tax=Lacinutrix iliipiscaria TaxID=1230532 RepID=A0ABW5WPI2_9FLAO
MSAQFCKVGRRFPNLKNALKLKAIEDQTVKFIEVINKPKTTKDFDVAS